MSRIYLQDRQSTPKQGVYVPTKKTYLKDRAASGVPMVKPLTKTQIARQEAKQKRFDKNLANAQSESSYYQQQSDQAGSILGLIKNTITGIPQAVGTLGSESVHHPINTLRSVASGVYEGAVKPIVKLPSYALGDTGRQIRQGLDLMGSDLAGNQNQVQQDIRSGFKFGGAVAPYELAGNLAAKALPNAPKLAQFAGWLGGGQVAYEGENNVKDRAKQAALDTLLFGLTKGAGKVVSTFKKPLPEATPYVIPTEVPKVATSLQTSNKPSEVRIIKNLGQVSKNESFDSGLFEFKRDKYLTDIWKQATSSGSESIPKATKAAITPLAKESPKSAVVSERVGQDVSLPNIVSQSGTDVRQKVNILDALRTPDRVLKKIGLEKEMNLVRTQHDKYLTELPKQIEKIDVWAKQLTPESNQKVFRFLDGENIQLTPQETKIAGEIRTYLKDWADRLKLPEDKRITNYITHIFDKDFIKKEFPDELARIIDNRVAGSVYDPFTLKRLGKLGYVPDVIRALDAYTKRAVRKVHMDVALEQMQKASKHLELSQFKYVKSYIDRVNLRPTEIDNAVDNTIKSAIGYKLGSRPTAALTQSARQWIYRGTLGLNPASALKNLSQGANTYAKLGEKYTIRGYSDLVKNWRSGELEKVGVLQDNFIQDRTLSAGKKALQKFDDGLMTFFQGAEKINRGAAYYGAKAKALSEGLTEPQAIEYAKKIVRDTQFTFGSIDTPPILQSDIGKTLGQFQSFTIKQGEFLGEMLAAKDIAGLLRYALASTVYITAIGSAFGMKPSDAIPSFRFGVPPTLNFPVQIAKSVLGAPNQYGQPTGMNEITKAGITLIPAGVQLNKTLGGLNAYNQGMVTNNAGNAQYPVEQSLSNLLRLILLGKYNTPEGRQYFDNNESPLSAYQTQKLREQGPDYYKEIMRLRDIANEKEKLRKYKKENTPFYTK